MAQKLEKFDFDAPIVRTYKRRRLASNKAVKRNISRTLEETHTDRVNGGTGIANCDVSLKVPDRRDLMVKLLDTADGNATLVISKTGVKVYGHNQKHAPISELKWSLLASLCSVGL